METQKRLCKVKDDKLICGVCGGIAAYWDVDSIVVRLAFVLLCFVFGLGLLIYIVLALLMPMKKVEAPVCADSVASVFPTDSAPSEHPVDFCDPALAVSTDSAAPAVPSDSAAPAVPSDSAAPAVSSGFTVSGAPASADGPVFADTAETTVPLQSSIPLNSSVSFVSSVPAMNGTDTECEENADVRDSSAMPGAVPEAIADTLKETQEGITVNFSKNTAAELPKNTAAELPKNTAAELPKNMARETVGNTAQGTYESVAGRKRRGVVLIIFGAALLLKFIVPFLSVYLLGSIAAIASGIVMISGK